MGRIDPSLFCTNQAMLDSEHDTFICSLQAGTCPREKQMAIVIRGIEIVCHVSHLLGLLVLNSKGCETLGEKMEGADLFRLVSVHRLK